MDYKVEFIKAAEKGGYHYINDYTDIDITFALLDPKCFECAGKTLGWTTDGEFPEGMTIGEWEKRHWKTRQHAWLDIKQSNGDEGEFFRNLIEKK